VADTGTEEFDPREAEKSVGVRVEERLQAIEEKLGLGAFKSKSKDGKGGKDKQAAAKADADKEEK
jgi:hypothetical protein